MNKQRINQRKNEYICRLVKTIETKIPQKRPKNAHLLWTNPNTSPAKFPEMGQFVRIVKNFLEKKPERVPDTRFLDKYTVDNSRFAKYNGRTIFLPGGDRNRKKG